MAAKREIVSGASTKTLTHEVGAGAPCLKCGDKCPGLDLHFWRKICRNCKCKQEDHDVIKSVSTRGIENIGKLLMQDRGETYNRPNLPKAESPSQSPVKVKKPATTKVVPPAPATKPEKQVSNVKTTPAANSVTLDAKSLTNEVLPPSPPKNDVLPPPPAKNDVLPPPPAKNDVLPPPPPTSNYELAKEFPLPPPPLPKTEEAFPAPPVLSLPQEFEENVTIPKDEPSVIQSDPPTSKNDISNKVSDSTSSPSKSDKEFDWFPPVSEKLMQEYMQALPEEKQPIAGTEGAKHRKKQLMRQLPAHDQEPSECHDLTSQETDEMNAFVKRYKEKALGVGNVEEGDKPSTCAECNEPLKVGEPIVMAERAGTEKKWHPKCFVCHKCKELLVDLIYFYHEDKIYCGRHYCELHKPRCAACDELIFAPEYTQAEDSFWHLKHFCCFHCDQPLGGQNYVPLDNQPVCIPCYEKTFAHSCITCKEIIAPDTEWVTFENYHWHAQPDCFKCSQCEVSLVGKPCIPNIDMIFCSSKCKKENIAVER